MTLVNSLSRAVVPTIVASILTTLLGYRSHTGAIMETTHDPAPPVCERSSKPPLIKPVGYS
jgi:hypothetical protein